MVNGIDMTYVTETCTGTCWPKCTHSNGWYANILFWVFTRKIFVCSDCGEALWGKKLSIMKKSRQ